MYSFIPASFRPCHESTRFVRSCFNCFPSFELNGTFFGSGKTRFLFVMRGETIIEGLHFSRLSDCDNNSTITHWPDSNDEHLLNFNYFFPRFSKFQAWRFCRKVWEVIVTKQLFLLFFEEIKVYFFINFHKVRE